MPNGYTAPFRGVTISAQQDLWEVQNAATKVLVVQAIRLGNVGGASDAGDAQEELLSIVLRRAIGSITSGSGGTSISGSGIPKLETGAPNAAATVEMNNTTKAVVGTGTLTDMDPDSWNVRQSYLWTPTPECQIVLAPSERLIVELATTPVDSLTVNGVLYFQELG